MTYADGGPWPTTHLGWLEGGLGPVEGAADDFVEAGERPPDPLGLQVLLHILPTHEKTRSNYFLRFRFRLLTSSGSGNYFWQFTVPVPASYLNHKKQFSKKLLRGYLKKACSERRLKTSKEIYRWLGYTMEVGVGALLLYKICKNRTLAT